MPTLTVDVRSLATRLTRGATHLWITVLDRLFPSHEKRVLRKLLRSWFIQGIGWYALVEVVARLLLEGGFLLLLWWHGVGLLPLLLGGVLFHTAVWICLYGGFMRIWIVLGFSTELRRLHDHLHRLEVRARSQSLFRLVYVRGSAARGEMNPRSDIDIHFVPNPGIRAKVWGILYLWAVRAESMLRQLPVEARWIDAERYVPYHVIDETPRILFRREAPRPPLAARLASRGVLVALSGIDGSGNTTVARRVVERLREAGLDAVYVWGHRQALHWRGADPYVPLAVQFESLWRRIGRSREDLARHPLAKLLHDACVTIDFLYVCWRVSEVRRPNRIVVLDRYLADTVAYLRSWGEFKVTLEGLLLGACPPPDVGVLLEVPPEEALRRKKEWPLAHLRRFRDEFSILKDRLHLVPVDATGTREQVEAQVFEALESEFGPLPLRLSAVRAQATS